MRKSVPLTLLALVLSIALTSVGTASPIPTITQANPTTTVYLHPPTINGTVIGQNFTVNIMIRDANNIRAWQAGLTFNATLLECTDFKEGEFLSDEGDTFWTPGTINNTAGWIFPPYGCTTLRDPDTGIVPIATGDGRLAYATFKVKAPGVSDIHLSNVKVLDYELREVPVNIIDVYTAIRDAAPHTVVIVSNSSGTIEKPPGSGFYGHSFNPDLNETSFYVTGPYPGFSNVTIPKALLPPPEPPRVWAVVINGTARIIEAPTENTTHTILHLTYPKGLNDVHITTRFMPSTISIALSEDSIPLGESVTISGNVTAADNTVRKNVTVTIQNRTKGDEEWDTLATEKTDQNGEYTYTWEPGTSGTYEFRASWEGDLETIPAKSDVLTLKVKGAPGIPIEIVAVVVVAIIVILAIIVYFVKIRKS